ncbi:NAD-dependent epimerase/dehydratase family protein [Phenylobacterium sp. VNQ135]|uniref:NAD-dependent epimerase/dehydratase family protein n=1 Tax=Phenylobacterium sp. VNQ135 TaxID=3400922 RepID=UPI003BFD8531
MSQIVLVGATGFLGRNVLDALVADGRDVVAVSASGAQPPGARTGLTLDELESYQGLSEQPVLVNVAARRYDARTFSAEQDLILSQNLALVQRVYEICARRGIREIRQASSVAVYPADRQLLSDEQPLDLNAAPHPGEAFYGWSKRWGEILAGLHRQRHGASTVSFRITNPFGPHDTLDAGAAHVATAFVLRALEPGPEFPLRGGHIERDFIYAGDVAAAILATLDWRRRQEVYNLGRGENTTLAELARAVLAAAGSDKRIVADEAPASGPAARRITADRIRADVPVVWRSLDEGLALTVEWYRRALAR